MVDVKEVNLKRARFLSNLGEMWINRDPKLELVMMWALSIMATELS